MDSNTFNTPVFNNNVFSEEITDSTNSILSLGEFTVCRKVKDDVTTLIYTITNFLNRITPNMDEIDKEHETYAEDPNFVINCNKLQENANDYIIQLGISHSIAPEFIQKLKTEYLNDPNLKSNIVWNKYLDSFSNEEIYKMATLPEPVLVDLTYKLLPAVIEKLCNDFSYAEFVYAGNVVIMKHNMAIFNLPGKLETINGLSEYIYDMCKHTASEVEDMILTLEAKLENSNITPTGEIDTTWLYRDRTQEQIDKIETVEMLYSIIINNSNNELKKISNYPDVEIVNTVYPSIWR